MPKYLQVGWSEERYGRMARFRLGNEMRVRQILGGGGGEEVQGLRRRSRDVGARAGEVRARGRGGEESRGKDKGDFG